MQPPAPERTPDPKLRRGGHDPEKVYAAFKAAVETRDRPTVILAKTIKGWTLGAGLEARNATHQIKKLDADALKAFRDRLYLEIPDHELEDGDPEGVEDGRPERQRYRAHL